MFNLNLRTAATASPQTPADTSATPALNEVPWTVIDAAEHGSVDSVPSTPSGEPSSPNTASHPHSPSFAEPQVLADQEPYPHCPIFIPSKGRADLDRSTMAAFVRDLVPFSLVVEQDEVEAYSALLDRLVGQSFGFAGMVYASPTATGAAPVSPPAESEKEKKESGADNRAATPAAEAAEAPADLWDFPCACCCRSRSSGDSSASQATPTATAIEALAQRLSTAFHHGYSYQPPTQSPVSGAEEDQRQGAGTAEDAGDHKTAGASAGAASQAAGSESNAAAAARRPSSAFVLHSVNEIRALFRIEVLPESNRGVSYVRNYILQVLVPRVMVACGVDRSGNVEELCLSGPGEHSTLTPAALRSAGLEAEVYSALQDKTDVERYLNQRRSRATAHASGSVKATQPGSAASAYGAGAAAADTAAAGAHRPASPSLPANHASAPVAAAQLTRDTPRLLHGLFGFYWVLDDDIYGFYAPQGAGPKQQRISSRAMLREVESRLRLLRRNADLASPPPPAVPPAGFWVSGTPSGPTGSSSGYFTPHQTQQYVFTCKEDALANNVSGGKSKVLTLHNYTLFYTTACFSLEYNRFAIGAAPDTLAVNSYNNIACLFNYHLLHNPPQMRYYPPGVPNVRRPEDALVGYLGHSMLWYRFAIREDYDFTLQLIARGLCTLRFRSLSFDVPQMMKVRGGMTDYYRNCHDEIRQQNDRFVLQWPAVAQHWVKGKDDTKRDDIRVRWDLLSPARVRHPGAFLYFTTPLPQLQPQRAPEDDSSGSGSGSGSSNSADDGETREGVAAVSLKRPRPKSPVTNVEDNRKGGYVVERWRDISPEEALQHVGLVALETDTIHIGQTVAAIPPLFEQRPSVVLATVIERSVKEESGTGGTQVVWTAVAQDVRGMPFLHVKTCYQPPAEGIVKAAEKLDQFFALNE